MNIDFGPKASRKEIKKKIIKDDLIKYECKLCSNKGDWLSQPLSLHLDHIDGNRYNNLLSNLRFLCPNCHSQQPTSHVNYKYGKKIVTENEVVDVAKSCKTVREILINLKLSDNNNGYSKIRKILSKHNLSDKFPEGNRLKRTRKVEWPSKEELESLVEIMPVTKIAKRYNVSDVAVKKWCVKLSVKLKPRGFWLKNAVVSP